MGTLKRPQIEALRDAVVESLEAGIDARGATIDDFRHVDGAAGSFQDRFQVHLRAGEPCPRCGHTIVKIRAAGRGTYLCPHDQRAPRIRRAECRARSAVAFLSGAAGYVERYPMVEQVRGTRRALVVTTPRLRPRDVRAERELVSDYLGEHRLRLGGEVPLGDATTPPRCWRALAARSWCCRG